MTPCAPNELSMSLHVVGHRGEWKHHRPRRCPLDAIKQRPRLHPHRFSRKNHLTVANIAVTSHAMLQGVAPAKERVWSRRSSMPASRNRAGKISERQFGDGVRRRPGVIITNNQFLRGSNSRHLQAECCQKLVAIHALSIIRIDEVAMGLWQMRSSPNVPDARAGIRTASVQERRRPP
jgi:hypothetical protein